MNFILSINWYQICIMCEPNYEFRAHVSLTIRVYISFIRNHRNRT